MKNTSFIAGFFAAFLLVVGTLAKTLHWPGANVMRVLGCAALIIASNAALVGAWKNKQGKTRLWRARVISGYFAALLIASGIIFGAFYLLSSAIQIVVGTALLALVFLPLYIYDLYAQNLTLEEKVAERTGELTRAMDNLTATQQQLINAHHQSEQARKKSDELLLNILPAEVAEELKASGSSTARQFDEVTVLFTDFKGFTRLSEQLSAKDLVAQINECFSAFDLIVQKHGVEKIKTIGDSYMAAGGLPTPNKTNPCDVVNAALEIRQYMLAHKLKKESEGYPLFEMRIGIHTGPVVAGIVGIKKFAYDIWGDTVNTAARMEQNSEPGKINISQTTYDLVKDKFVCEYRGEIDAKGKGAMKMYYVG